jgi:hypothetical protein
MVLAVSPTLVGIAFAQQGRIQVRLSPEEIDEVTFDPTRVTQEQLRRWILLSKDGPYNEATLSSCMELQADPTSKRYEQQRASEQKLISELDEAKYPPELSEVLRYLRRVRSLWFWIDTQQIRFLQTDNVSSLEQRYDDVDLLEACAKPIEKIRVSRNRAEAINAACFDWNNCVLAAGTKKIGPYPMDAWKAFLSTYGIREHIISTESRTGGPPFTTASIK